MHGAMYLPASNLYQQQPYTPRTDKYIIYKQLIKDLQTALVAWPNETDNFYCRTYQQSICKRYAGPRLSTKFAGYSLTADGTCAKSTDPGWINRSYTPLHYKGFAKTLWTKKATVALKEKNFQDIFEDICRDVVKSRQRIIMGNTLC